MHKLYKDHLGFLYEMSLTTYELIQSVIGISIVCFLCVFTCAYFCFKWRRDQPHIIYQRPSPLTLLMYRRYVEEIDKQLTLGDVRNRLEGYGMKEVGDEEECVICLERMDGMVYNLRCSHNFHRTCLEMSCQVMRGCPICRDELF